jgi:hypothetical protein
MKIVDAIVKKTNSELADSGRVLQEILAAGANERGEWELPLPAEKVAAMRTALDERAEHLNEVRGYGAGPAQSFLPCLIFLKPATQHLKCCKPVSNHASLEPSDQTLEPSVSRL